MRGLWLIDGSYIYKATKTYLDANPVQGGKGVDYKKLKNKIQEKFGIDSVDGWYFNSTPDPASDAQNAFHSWLKSTGMKVKLYGLKEKEIKCTHCKKTFKIKAQKGVDVGIATTAVKIFSRYDAILLSAGDGDFEDFIKYIVEENDKKLYIIGFDGSISLDLQQYSSENYLINEHFNDICDTRYLKPFDTVDEVIEE